MVKKIKRHIKKRPSKVVLLTEDEKLNLERERLFATAFSKQLGVILGKHVKKLTKGNNAEAVESDPFTRFLNNIQLMLIKTYELDAQEIIDCDTSLLPSKLTKLEVSTDDKKACQKAMSSMYISDEILRGFATMLAQNDKAEDAVYVQGLARDLCNAARWLGCTFNITDNCLEEPECLEN
ncbi:MAG: hypothetical protein MJZ34_02290 [Paludibacteraceae bacterium]|nr:hypothetical protein [Paludibacteraceae bacterium]